MDCELTNMIMIENLDDNTVLAEKRVKYWTGVTFPGGHIDKGESFTDSVIREAKEETGLDIKNPKLCGTVHWCHKESDRRYIVFLYKTSEFSGELKSSDEGDVFWVKKDEICNYKLSPHFDTYLKIFMSNKNEAFGLHDNDTDDEMIIL